MKGAQGQAQSQAHTSDDEDEDAGNDGAEAQAPQTPTSSSFMDGDFKDEEFDEEFADGEGDEDIKGAFSELIKELAARTRDLHTLRDDEDAAALLERIQQRVSWPCMDWMFNASWKLKSDNVVRCLCVLLLPFA